MLIQLIVKHGGSCSTAQEMGAAWYSWMSYRQRSHVRSYEETTLERVGAPGTGGAVLHYAACMKRGQRPGALVSEALREGRACLEGSTQTLSRSHAAISSSSLSIHPRSQSGSNASYFAQSQRTAPRCLGLRGPQGRAGHPRRIHPDTAARHAIRCTPSPH